MKKNIIILFFIFSVLVPVGYLTRGDIRDFVSANFPQLFGSIEESVAMSPDVLDAHLYMSSDTLVSIIHGWIPYYHRHRKYYEANEVILFLLKNNSFPKGYEHFFSMILKDYPEDIQQLTVLSEGDKDLGDGEHEIIDVILKKARSFQATSYDLPIKHEEIWGEYAVTGDAEIIRKYARFLDAQQFTVSDDVRMKISSILFGKSKEYYPVYRQILLLKDMFVDDYGLQLNKIYLNSYQNIFEKSRHYRDLGYNYQKEGKYSQAIETYMLGLHYSPDDSILFRNLGNIYLSQGDYYNALAAFRNAKWTTDHYTEEYILWRMAEAYNQLEDYPQVLSLYKEAYTINPNSEYTLVWLACAYEKNGEIESAENILRDMFTEKPSQQHISWAIKFFNRHNLIPPVVESSLQNLLLQHKFTEIETIMQASLNEGKRDINGKNLIYSLFYELMPDNMSNVALMDQSIHAHLEWLKVNPESHFANASLGSIFSSYAWEARGGGYSNTVTEKGWQLFNDRILLAAKYLQKAYELDPMDSVVANKMIKVAKVYPGWPDSKVEVWFNRAIQADPVGRTPYETKFHFLAPQWGGSDMARLDYARDVFKYAPKDSMAPVVLAQAHWAIYESGKNKNYIKRPDVWAELKTVYTELVKRYPQSTRRRNWFARTACFAGDYATAQKQFDTIGENWEKVVWQTYEQFDLYRTLALSK